MEITTFDLTCRNAPPVLIKQVTEKYKKKATLAAILNDDETSFESLHWINMTYDLTDEEQAAYWLKVKVFNSKNCFCSDNVKNSKTVLTSSFIENSQKINKGTHITDSSQVIQCNTISDSQNIFNSNFVFSSKAVINSNNITKSNNIVNSSTIINSDDIFRSNNIRNSKQIIYSNNMKNCNFCGWCKDLKFSLFCINKEKGANLLFNKEVDSDLLNTIIAQYNAIMTRNLSFFKDTDLDYLFTMPAINMRINEYYKNIEDRFWQWVKTLPNYDEEIISNITLGEI